MMSLRAFHIVFIIVSTALCAFLALWGMWYFKTVGGALGPSLSVVGLVGLYLLSRYYKWFRQKSFKVLPFIFATLIGSGIFAHSYSANACSSCYGDPNSSLVKGALWGVGALGLVIGMVLVFIFVVGRSWVKRAKAMAIEF